MTKINVLIGICEIDFGLLSSLLAKYPGKVRNATNLQTAGG